MKYIFFFLSALATTVVAAQPNVIDSLQRRIAGNAGNDSTMVKDLLNLGYQYIPAQPDEGLAFTEKAFAIARTIPDKKWQMLAYRQKGLISYYKGDFVGSIDYSLKALQLATEINHQLARTSILNNLANVYAELKDFTTARTYYHEHLATAEKLNNTGEKINGYGNLGTIYVDLALYDSAIYYLDKCLLLSKENRHINGELTALNNLGVAYARLHQQKKAIYYLGQTIKLSTQYENQYTLSSSLLELARIRMSQQNYPECIKLSKRSLAIAHEAGVLSWKAENNLLLSQAYEQLHDPRKALTYFKTYAVLSDSIISEDKKSAITRREMQFEADKKQALYTASAQKEKIIRSSIIAGAILLLVSGTALFVLYKKRRDTLQQQQQLLHKAQIYETEMKVLRLQMNPHFIFNSLNAIADYMGKNDMQAADYYLVKFSKLMRGILENAEEKEIPLADELAMTELYMQLEASRLKQLFRWKIQLADDIDPITTLVPPLLLQPFVENCIWHGFANINRQGTIFIRISRENSILNCVVEDDGIGRQVLTGKSHRSLGIKITRERIALLPASHSGATGIYITDLEQGTRVEIKLPFETEIAET